MTSVLLTQTNAQAIGPKLSECCPDVDLLCQPLTYVQSSPVSHQQLFDLSQQLQQADAIIFTSQNAVACYVALCADHDDLTASISCPILAVGPATCEAISQAGLGSVCYPNTTESFGAEALLAMPQTQRQSQFNRFVFITGSPRRDVIETSLVERGKHIDVAAIYQVLPNIEGLSALKSQLQHIDVVVLSSQEAIRVMTQVLSIREMGQYQWLVGSERLRDALLALDSRLAVSAAQSPTVASLGSALHAMLMVG